MTDITHDNIFTNSDTVPRLRRILDEGPGLPERAADHETSPRVPAPAKSGGQAMIEATIGHVDKATDLVLETLERLESEITRTREILQTSKLQAHDVLRGHMIILETAMQSANQFAQQFVDATSKLAARNGGGNAGQ